MDRIKLMQRQEAEAYRQRLEQQAREQAEHEHVMAEYARTGLSPQALCVCGERAKKHEGRLGPCGPCPRFELAGPEQGPRPKRRDDEEDMF